MINLNETIQTIKRVGTNNVRTVPMPGQSVNGDQYQIEIMEGTCWRPIVTGVTKRTAEDLIAQATNKVILG